MAPANQGSTTQNTESGSKLKRREFSDKLHSLLPLDPRSKEFLDLFRSFLSSKDERKKILELSEPDARLFIEIIDRAFRAARLDVTLRTLAFAVLRRLCGRIGHLPDSYLLSGKFDHIGNIFACGRIYDVRRGVFQGKDVAIKHLRGAGLDDKARRFCKEVAMWKNLSHPNVLDLIGVPNTLEEGGFSTVSELMANGNLMEYVRGNAGNHLKLLADAAEGLKYLHNANIVHGYLKGANILITNKTPVSACLAGFGFMTIVHDPGFGMESSNSAEYWLDFRFTAPERLHPSKFGLDTCKPSKEADVYALAMTIYQVLTGSLPFGKLSGSEAVFKVLMGERPSKPANALKLGLSNHMWRLLEDCWKMKRTSRPSIKDVLARIKAAASACGTLSLRDVTPKYDSKDSDSDVSDFGRSLLRLPSDVEFTSFIGSLFLEMSTDDEELGAIPTEHPLGQGPILTDTSLPDSLSSNLPGPSEAGGHISGPPQRSANPLPLIGRSKSENAGAIPGVLFSPTLDPVYRFQITSDRISRSSTFCSEVTTGSRSLRNDMSPYRNGMFSESSGSSRVIFPDVISGQREQPTSDTVRQLRRPSSASSLASFCSPPTGPGVLLQTDGHAELKSRVNRFRIGGDWIFSGDTHK